MYFFITSSAPEFDLLYTSYSPCTAEQECEQNKQHKELARQKVCKQEQKTEWKKLAYHGAAFPFTVHSQRWVQEDLGPDKNR